jgi:hypothetical protein
MRTGGVSGGPIRQALTPGPFLMARWLTNRKGLAYPPILCPDLAALVFTAAASGPYLNMRMSFIVLIKGIFLKPLRGSHYR